MNQKSFCQTYIHSALLEFQNLKPHLKKVLNKGAIAFVTGSVVQISSDLLTIFSSNLNFQGFNLAILKRSMTRGIQFSCAAQSISFAKYIRSKKEFLPLSSNYYGSLFYSSLGLSAIHSFLLTPFVNINPISLRFSFQNYSYYAFETFLRTFGYISGYSTIKQIIKDKPHLDGYLGKYLLSYTAGKTCESILLIPYSRYVFRQPLHSQFMTYVKSFPTFLNNATFSLALKPLTKKLISG